MANWWDKNLTDKQKFRLQEPQDASLLDVVANVPTPVGDVASGLLAAQDFSKGNYGTAALNSLGLFPLIPSMGAIVKNSDNLFHGSLGNLIGDLRSGKGTLGEGFYLTNTENQAALYPKLHAKLNKIDNPDIVVTPMTTTAKNIYELNDLPVGGVDVNKLKKLGYDGISYNNELMVFDPNKVKVLKRK